MAKWKAIKWHSKSKKNQIISYEYDNNGIRTQKTVNGVTTNYYLDDNRVIFEKTGDTVLYYTYDENARVLGITYNGVQYYYIRNLQEDIVGILNNNFNQVVSYTYDSWGNVVSIKDGNGQDVSQNASHIGNVNPYRYRGYRYDKETGLYYLQSRYYCPKWGRFINADYTLLDQGAGLIGHNMYVYSANNPINNSDPTGKSILIGIVIGVTALIFGGATVTQAVINNKQLNNSQNMLIKAVTGSNLSNRTKQSLVTKTQNSPELKKEVQKAITANNGNNFSNHVTRDLAYTSGDLGLSIGKVTKTTISGIKNKANSWNISVTLSDRYNFDEWRKMNSFGSVANNLGLIGESLGQLTPYDWDISFSFNYCEE